MKKEIEIFKYYSVIQLIISIITSIVLLLSSITTISLSSSLLSKVFMFLFIFILIAAKLVFPILMFIGIKKEKKYAGHIGLIDGYLHIFVSLYSIFKENYFSFLENVIFGIFLIYISNKYLKIFEKNNSKSMTIKSVILSITTIIIGIYSTFVILFISAFALSAHNSPINNPNIIFCLILITSIVTYLSLLILSIMKKNSAGILGIIIGIILCLTIINIVPGIILIIVSIIYLNSFPKEKKFKNKINTEYGQKVVYAKSFSDDEDSNDNEISIIDKLPKDSKISNICLILSLISILFLLMNLSIVSLILSIVLLFLSIRNIKKKEINIYFSLIVSIIIIGIVLATIFVM